jgi:phage regulator Rha-like protein
MYHAHGKTAREIAEIEGSNHKTVLESIWAAEKKIKKVLAGG